VTKQTNQSPQDSLEGQTHTSPLPKPAGAVLALLMLPYPPLSGNHANRQGLGRTYKRPEAVAYELEIKRRIVTSRYAGATIDEPIAIELQVWPPDRRARDQTNVCKVLEDALTRAKFWADDSNRIIKRTTFQWHDFDAAEAKEGCVMLTVTRFPRLSQ
jgi:crossover junction endodeoxyribonuclease RusA